MRNYFVTIIYTIWAGFGFPCSCLVLRGSGSHQLQQPTTTSVRLLGTPCSCMAIQVQQPSIRSEGLGLGSGSRVRFGRWTGGRFCRCTTIFAGLGSPSSWTARIRRSLRRYMARVRVANSICCPNRRRSAERIRALCRVVFRRQRAEVWRLPRTPRLSRRVLQPRQVARRSGRRLSSLIVVPSPVEHSQRPHRTVGRPRRSRRSLHWWRRSGGSGATWPCIQSAPSRSQQQTIRFCTKNNKKAEPI